MTTKDVTLYITMSDSDWVEVIAALDTKMSLVKDNYYGEDDTGDNAKWLAELQSARDKLAAALDKAGCRY